MKFDEIRSLRTKLCNKIREFMGFCHKFQEFIEYIETLSKEIQHKVFFKIGDWFDENGLQRFDRVMGFSGDEEIFRTKESRDYDTLFRMCPMSEEDEGCSRVCSMGGGGEGKMPLERDESFSRICSMGGGGEEKMPLERDESFSRMCSMGGGGEGKMPGFQEQIPEEETKQSFRTIEYFEWFYLFEEFLLSDSDHSFRQKFETFKIAYSNL